MKLLSAMLLAHLAGDWLFQPDSWASRKNWLNKKLLLHALVYTVFFSVAILFGLPTWALFLIFVIHVFQDTRISIPWWIKFIKRVKGKPTEQLLISIDQIFHIILILIFAIIFG